MTLGSKLLLVLAMSFFLAQAFLPGVAYANDQQVEVCRGTDCDEADNFVNTYLNPVVKALTALVGIAAVVSIIFAGIQYSSSADDPGTVTKAKQRVFNVVIGLLAYIFLLALLNYLIPGGVF